jgi:NAD-dependent deacetylase
MQSFLKALDEAQRVTFLTGAGVSTASGIPDFKSTDETWPYEEPRQALISLRYFQRNPERFWRIYREVFSSKFNAQENVVHRWIGNLERTKEVQVVTQNVDGLHQKGGSTSVIEAHGTNTKAVCMKCRHEVPMESVADQALPRCPVCRKVLKPAVCLFDEPVSAMPKIEQMLHNTDLLVVMGTSLEVGPVNYLPIYAHDVVGLPTAWVNGDLPPLEYNFDHTVRTDLVEFVASALFR